MNEYIRDYKVDPISTLVVESHEGPKVILESKSELTIFHTNIRSMGKNFDEFQAYMSQFENQYPISCIILSETWKVHDISLFNMHGYNSVYNGSPLNKSDGIMVYIRDTIRSTSKQVNLGETQAVFTEFDIGKKKISILSIYRSPSTSIQMFNDRLEHFLSNVNVEIYDQFYIIGDINIDLMDDSDELTQEYINLLSEKGFVSLINTSTRVTHTTATCLDHAFVKMKNERYSADITPAIIRTNITDHYSLILGTNITNTINKTQKNYFMKY